MDFLSKNEGIDLMDPEIKEKLTTKNIYKIFNNYIIPLISKEEKSFLLELENFLMKEIEPKINLNQDVYELFPLLGKANYIQRLNQHKNIQHYGMRYEMLLAMALSILDPELDLARVVSGVIFANPLFQFGKGKYIEKILDDVISGNKVGCICITERKHGSDAVNMKTKIIDDASKDYIIIDGEKIFTTNGPVGDYFIVYGVSNDSNPRGTMYQVIVEKEYEGFKANRLNVPSIPRVHVGQSIFDNVKIPRENIIGAEGRGYQNLFTGLVAERDAIIGSSLGICWLAAISAFIYTNFREQFGKKIYNFQSVSFPLTKLFTELMAATSFGLNAANEFRKTIDYSDPKFVKYNASFSSGTKFLVSNLAHRLSYEVQQLCGGIAFTDNMKIEKALEVAKVQEIIGGARNIQLYLVSNGIKRMIAQL